MAFRQWNEFLHRLRTDLSCQSLLLLGGNRGVFYGSDQHSRKDTIGHWNISLVGWHVLRAQRTSCSGHNELGTKNGFADSRSPFPCTDRDKSGQKDYTNPLHFIYTLSIICLYMVGLDISGMCHWQCPHICLHTVPELLAQMPHQILTDIDRYSSGPQRTTTTHLAETEMIIINRNWTPCTPNIMTTQGLLWIANGAKGENCKAGAKMSEPRENYSLRTKDDFENERSIFLPQN